MIRQDLNSAPNQQGKEQEVDIVVETQPKREIKGCNLVSHVATFFRFLPRTVLVDGCEKLLLNDFVGALCEVSAG